MNEAQCAKTMQIIDTHGRDPAALIAILQDVQAENSYLSQENLELIAKELNVAISKVYGVATFFENFSLEAKGKHRCPCLSRPERQAQDVRRRPVYTRDGCMSRRVRPCPCHDDRWRGPREDGP